MPKPLKVYNNLTRSKVDFKTIEPGKVKFYSCGPTTYDFLHVGNARALVVGDLFNRILDALGYDVTFVRNFTDVDDKIIDRANERGEDPLKWAAKFVDECQKDMKSLGMNDADETPKVSETMPEIIKMIQDLLENDSAYEVEGEVLYHVPSFKEYGKLSKKDLESLQHGIRVEVESHKKHPSDFVLWKPAKEGEPSWDSPWGKGRPGWHIECSAMAKKFLGTTIDIHHGGVDLMFPHHENEIAQSEAANGCEFSNHWCHHEFLNFGDEKMSKSLGNVKTIRDFVTQYGGEVLRQMLASVHYRSVMNFNDESIERAMSEVERIHDYLVNYDLAKGKNTTDEGEDENLSELMKIIPLMQEDLANDFNLPGAMAHFFTVIRLVNRDYLDTGDGYEDKKALSPRIIEILDRINSFTRDVSGLLHYHPTNPALNVLGRIKQARKNLLSVDSNLSDADIEDLIQQRSEARANKDWAKADEVRDKLNSANIVVKDNPDGSASWTYGKN